MRKHELYTDYHDHFEYFGNTEIERIRKQGETIHIECKNKVDIIATVLSAMSVADWCPDS